MAAFPDNPFWDFSVRVYGGRGVAPACLALQDRHGLDVNLLLLCCWLGHCRAAAPTRAEVARLVDAVAGWHRDVVRPLREARRRLKAPGRAIGPDLAAALREQVKRIELDAEHIEQLALAAALPPGKLPTAPLRAHAAAALGFYLDIVGVSPDDTERTHLETLLAAAFPEVASARPEAPATGRRGPS
jgi:uncharacterized protein (TIGR02444 family)